MAINTCVMLLTHPDYNKSSELIKGIYKTYQAVRDEATISYPFSHSINSHHNVISKLNRHNIRNILHQLHTFANIIFSAPHTDYNTDVHEGAEAKVINHMVHNKVLDALRLSGQEISESTEISPTLPTPPPHLVTTHNNIPKIFSVEEEKKGHQQQQQQTKTHNTKNKVLIAA